MIPNMNSEHWGDGDIFVPVSTDPSNSLIQLALPVQPNTQVHHIYLHINHGVTPLTQYGPRESFTSSYGSDDAYRHDQLIDARHPSAVPTPPYTTDGDSNGPDLIITQDNPSREHSRSPSQSVYDEQANPDSNDRTTNNHDIQKQAKEERRSRSPTAMGTHDVAQSKDFDQYSHHDAPSPRQSPSRGRSLSPRPIDGYETDAVVRSATPTRDSRPSRYESTQHRAPSHSPAPSELSDRHYNVQSQAPNESYLHPVNTSKSNLRPYPLKQQPEYYQSPLKSSKVPPPRKCPLAHQDGTKHPPGKPHPGYTSQEYRSLCYAFQNGYDYSALIKNGSRVAQPPRPPVSGQSFSSRPPTKRPAHEMDVHEHPDDMVSYKRRRVEPAPPIRVSSSRYAPVIERHEEPVYMRSVPVAAMPPASYSTTRTVHRPGPSYYVEHHYKGPNKAKRGPPPPQHYY